jgi:sec-independent protein translocase protein TatA
MGTFGPIHWIVVAVIVLLLFGGRGRLSGMMGDAAKGIKAFREGLKGDEESKKDEEPEEPPAKPLPKSASAKTTSSRAKTTAKTKTVS